ncbi:hypothetical protein GUJ93_ZPchr0011g27793 [Zizania palustris]|uniref:Uncharacterized protein n=1 Tax=Zizania palustris TaxID=103762 RepID=A0A8J5WH33_ZIZPA|nr:hypothetical protein GUJ93_ZPchr0011g27793 [Zizania palustris]
MVENGIPEQPKGVSRNGPRAQTNSHSVDPGQLPVLTWEHKLSNIGYDLPSFRLTWRESFQLAGLGLRLGRHILEETSKGRLCTDCCD